MEQRERRNILGTTWEWKAESGTRYQLFWQTDTKSMMFGVARDGVHWSNTVCSDANGIRRFPTLADARAFAATFVSEANGS